MSLYMWYDAPTGTYTILHIEMKSPPLISGFCSAWEEKPDTVWTS